jgi:lipopolysaccharide exporter
MAEAIGKALTLKEKAVRGAKWTLPTSLGSRAVGLVGTLLVARYLTPAQYGEVTAALIVVMTASSVTTFGVGTYLVANRDLTRAETFHATCWFLATGAAALLAVLAFAGPLGEWSGAPDLRRFMPAFALTMVLDRVEFLPERILVRQLRFGWLSLARAFGELAYTVVSVAMASVGAGAMAIVWGCIARSTLRLLAVVPAVERRDWLEPNRLRLSTVRRILGYGVSVSVANVATFGMRRWDNLLVSRYFGAAIMGQYNYAYNLADMPAVAIGEQVGDVIAAALPHVDSQKRAAALVRSSAVLSMVMFPLALGLGAVAPTLVQTIFNDRWAHVGQMLVLLSALSALRPIANLIQSHFYACHRPQVVAWMEWASLAAIIVGIATVGRAGIQATCAVVGAVFVFRTLAGMWLVQRQDGIPIRDFLAPLAKPLGASLLMAGAVVAVRPALEGLPAVTRLVAEVAVGVVVYGVCLLSIARPAALEFLSLVRLSVRPR